MTRHAATQPPYTWKEAVGVMILLGIFFILGCNGIRNHAYIGQDFGFHYESTLTALGNADRWFFMDVTSRPAIYWTGVAGFNFGGMRDGIKLAALFNLTAGTVGLWIIYDSVRSTFHSAALRLGMLAFIAFLPVTVITTLVYAADTTAILPFALVCWGAIRLLEAKTPREWWFPATVLGITLSVAQFTKATFLLVPLTVTVALLLAWRFRLGRKRAVLWGCAFAILIPLSLGVWLHHAAGRQLADEAPRHSYNWRGTGEMTWRSLLWPRSSDKRLFSAPSYGDIETRGEQKVQSLIERNGYSYPALLHLGIFSDILGARRHAPGMDGLRTPIQKRSAIWALHIGVISSLGMLVSALVFVLRALRGIRTREISVSPACWIWGSLALGWFLPIVLVLPYVHFAYDWGYWLPRLVLPSIWGFGAILFGICDVALRNFRNSSTLAWGICLFTLAQSAVHFCSLWS